LNSCLTLVALLRAIAQKLIPGMSYSTRVAILQQTSETAVSEHPSSTRLVGNCDADATKPPSKLLDRTTLPPLARILSADKSRNLILHEYEQLSNAIDNASDALAPIRALRSIQLSRLRKQLVEVDKNARLRSGARGLAARKELISFEKKVEEAEELCAQADPEIDAAAIERETDEAVGIWTVLQGQAESYGSAAAAEKRALAILNGLGFSEAMRGKPFKNLSGGWQMRCLLPTNFLDLLGIVWLQRFLLELLSGEEGGSGNAKRGGRFVLIVSHDRDFVDSVCTETLILRDKTLVPFRGTPSAYEADLRSRILYMSRMKGANDRQVKAVEKSISADMRDAKARGNDNKIRAAKVRQKRLERTGMQVSSTGTRFKLSRDRQGWHHDLRGEIEVPTEERGMGGMTLPEASGLRFPGALVSLEGVGWRYKAGLPMVLQRVDLVVHMGDRIGIVGLNGCGKTTLVKLITEAGRKPTAGSVGRHAQLKLGYYSQHAVEDLQALEDPTLTALSLMTTEVDGALSEGNIRGRLGSLGLPGRTASDVPISKLSGGQLVRLALARIIWNSPNLLVLDEITTHLDHYTVSALIDALKDYDGALILISHDRFLIRCVVQGQSMDDDGDDAEDVEEDTRRRIVYLMKGGKLKSMVGGVEDFEKSLERRLLKLVL
jgi:ATPase subunit of ABC transporter with duplicated ATPase domains